MTDFNTIHWIGVAVLLVVGLIGFGFAAGRKWLDMNEMHTGFIFMLGFFLIFIWPAVLAMAVIVTPFIGIGVGLLFVGRKLALWGTRQ